MFYKLNVSFCNETDKSFYLAPRTLFDKLISAL